MSGAIIVFATKYGTTEKAASLIKDNLPGAVVCDLRKNPDPRLEEFDLVVIGGPIYAGKIHRAIKKFCRKNLEALLRKKTALFICCMYEGEKAEQQFRDAYTEKLRQSTSLSAIFGGELSLEKLNFLERFVIKKFIGVKESASRFQPGKIREFADRLRSI